jgi:uncharacterized protein DUF4197
MRPGWPELAAIALFWAAPAFAQLESITQKEAVAGLKTALEKGSHAAVAALGRPDGFLKNLRVRIPLPDSLRRVDRMARRVGLGEYSDELIVTMNRAAEAAVPEARDLLVEAVKKMTLRDAKGILSGGDTAATAYFRRTTAKQLQARFQPIVARATAKVGVARKYNEYAGKVAAFGLLEKEDADLDDYVTRKALEGLYLVIAEEEKKIRRDPVGSGSELLRKVFGALR